MRKLHLSGVEHLYHSIRSLVAIQAWDVFRLCVVEY